MDGVQLPQDHRAITGRQFAFYHITPFHGWGSTAARPQSHYGEAVCFLPHNPFSWMGFNCRMATKPLLGGILLSTTSSQKFLVLIWSTSEGWKSESTLGPSVDLKTDTLDWESSVLTTMSFVSLSVCAFYAF